MTNNTNDNVLTIQTPPKVRNSGIELLKIIAILLICISHAVQTSEQFLNYDYLTFGIAVLKILRYFGQIGNIIFVICSSWFLLDSKKVKPERVLKILFDSMCISILIFLGFVFAGYKFSTNRIIQQLFPDIFFNVWFIPVYALFYLIHPLLNTAINKMNKKSHLIFCLVIFSIYSCLGLIIGFGGILINFFGFIVLYFIIAFIKRYCERFYKNRKLNLYLYLGFVLLFLLIAIAKSVFNLEHLEIGQFCSPVLLPMLICLFNLFNSLNFTNKSINYFAGCSLFVYCIHENILVRSIARPLYYEKVLSICLDAYLGWIFLCAIGMFLSAYILSVLYKQTLSKLTQKLSKQSSYILVDIGSNLFNRTNKNSK